MVGLHERFLQRSPFLEKLVLSLPLIAFMDRIVAGLHPVIVFKLHERGTIPYSIALASPSLIIQYTIFFRRLHY